MTASLTRRGLLGSIGLSTLALTACGSPTSKASEPAAPDYSKVFVIAHRGGARNWPEMTVYAYQQAAKLPGIKAMEVSVRRAKDGMLVCHHDADTSRVGTKSLVIAQSTWPQLATVAIKPKYTLDRTQPGRPLARLDEVLAIWPKGVELWIEPKSDDAVEPLFKKLSNHPELTIVWKRPINAPGFDRAKAKGWRTFGYAIEGAKQDRYLETLSGNRNIDMIGVQVESSDERIRRAVNLAGSYGKPVVAWALADLKQRDRVLKLGVRGLMCSDIVHLIDAPMPA